jgi:hypothetical protein
MRRIFSPEKSETTVGWKKFYDENPLNLYNLPDIIRVINSRRMR